MRKKIMLIIIILLLINPSMTVSASELDIQSTITYAFCEKWEELEENERIAYEMLLQQEVAKDLGIDVPKTVFYDTYDSYLGYYNFTTHTLYINNYYIDEPKKLIGTICHEMRHAWQDVEITKGTAQGQQYLNNLLNYIAPSEAGIFSYMTENIVEVDAFAYQNMQTQKYLSEVEFKTGK